MNNATTITVNAPTHPIDLFRDVIGSRPSSGGRHRSRVFGDQRFEAISGDPTDQFRDDEARRRDDERLRHLDHAIAHGDAVGVLHENRPVAAALLEELASGCRRISERDADDRRITRAAVSILESSPVLGVPVCTAYTTNRRN